MGDAEMKGLAEQLADEYMNVFWDDLRMIFEERFLDDDPFEKTEIQLKVE